MVDNTCSLTNVNAVLTYVLIFFLVLLICYVIFYIFKMVSTNKYESQEESFTTSEVKPRKKIIGFFMPGCGYCVQFRPIFDKVVKEYATSEKFNMEWSVLAESNTTLAKTKYNISSFPSVVIVDNDVVVEVKVGSMSEPAFRSFLEKYVSI